MFRIGLPSFVALALAAWSAAAQPFPDDGLYGPPASAYGAAIGAQAYGGVAIDAAPLPFDPSPLPPNMARGECVERELGGAWRRCSPGGPPRGGAFPGGGPPGGPSRLPPPGFGGPGPGAAFVPAMSLSGGVGHGFGYGAAPWGFAPYPFVGPGVVYGAIAQEYPPPWRGYHLAGRDPGGYLVWPSKFGR